MKKLLKLGLVLMLSFLIIGCSNEGASENSTDAIADEEKVFVVAGDGETPGWVQTNSSGDVEGFDYDVWVEIAERTGYDLDFRLMSWDGLWAMIDSEQIDVVANQINMTDQRKEKYIFSDPYAYNPYVLITSKDHEILNSMDDIKDGMTIACEPNSSDEDIIDAIDEEYSVTLDRVYYDGMSVQEVSLGRCDLWPRAETSAILTVNEVDNLKILGETNQIEVNGYVFPKSERGEVLAKVADEALKEMREDGTLKELSMKWFDVDITEER